MRNLLSFSILFSIHLFTAETSKVYIVYLGETQHNDSKLVTGSHYDMLTTLMNSQELALESMVYSYKHGFSGFAAKLTGDQAQQLSEHPDVVAVMPNIFYKVQTTRSWDYLGLSSHNIVSKTNMGDGVIVGVLDTGIWPESKSFSDEGVGPIPGGWKGTCQSGDQFKPSKHCNRKVIGARWFVDGYLADIGEPVNMTSLGEFLSARDADGHGTHVSSTVAGAYVANVSYNGVGLGTARGGAPNARIAIYKVCWTQPRGMCSSADILKAFDEAIKDGVHVLSLSIAASSLPLYSEVDGRDAIAVGSFHAVKKGITVVCGAGNDGPSPQSVKNIAPWIITVAATSMDRAFTTPITLGNNKTFLGQSIYRGKEGKLRGLSYTGDRGPNAPSVSFCEDLLAVRPSLYVGKIVLCFAASSTPLVTSFAVDAVKAGGGVGVIVAKPSIGITGQCGSLPCAEVDYQTGTQILYYIRSTKNPAARIDPPSTLVGDPVSAKVAEFSSRGPNTVAPSVLKPDISAPGVQIIAATSGLDASAEQGYTMLSGTSMSTPHIAAIVALVRSRHPTWSPAAIKSALVTTAWTSDSYGIPVYAVGSPHKLADPFDFGGGIANPNAAACPGLIYDMGPDDYVHYFCGMEYKDSDISKITGQTVECRTSKAVSLLDLNLPSITIPNLRLGHSTILTRTVTNVGPTNSVYRVIVEAPVGTHVFVDPPVLMFNSGRRKMSYRVRVSSLVRQVDGEYYFGRLTWSDGVHHVRSPIAVRSAMWPDDCHVAAI